MEICWLGCDNGDNADDHSRSLRRFARQGSALDARVDRRRPPRLSGVLHVDVRDSAGELWRLITQDAEWTPSDPAQLIGRSVENAQIDEESGTLHCRLSDGSRFDVVPTQQEADDDPPNWELIAPDGLVLEFGPGMRWRIGSADARVSSP